MEKAWSGSLGTYPWSESNFFPDREVERRPTPLNPWPTPPRSESTLLPTPGGAEVRPISLKRAIEEAGKKGIGFIAAAGNHNGNNDSRPSYPASYDLDNVIAVGSHDHRGNKAGSSCYGKKSVDLFAPGVNIHSTVPGNRYATYSGTSMATPHVAGAYALVQSLNPDWTCKQIKETLMNSTDEEAGLKKDA